MTRPHALILCILAGCVVPDGAGNTRNELACTLAVLRTGPRTEPLTPEQSAEFFGGHFANMARLHMNGDLLLAGPFGREKSAPDLRGLFVFETEDLARAQAIAETDPCFRAGIFAFELHAMRTRSPLLRCAAAERERTLAAEREGRELAPGDGCRNYVIVTVKDGTRADALAAHESVCFTASLADDRVMFWLTCDTRDEAVAVLTPLLAKVGPFTIDEWFGTELLAATKAAAGR